MSKRFGRNQRRAARERITTLEQALQMDRALLARVGERKRQLEQEINDAKRIVGRMSTLFEPEVRRLDGPARSLMRVFTHSAVTDDGQAFSHNQAQTIPLPVMLSMVDKDGLAGSIHCKVVFDDGQWGYAISEDAILATPEDILVERIALSLAKNIGQQLKEVKPGRVLWR
jgi:hypothetical protein